MSGIIEPLQTLIRQKQRVAEIECLTIALQQLRVVEERRRRARVHAGTLHFPDRAMRRPQTDDHGRVSSGSRLMALMTARNLGGGHADIHYMLRQ